jgi:hypothetical protein
MTIQTAVNDLVTSITAFGETVRDTRLKANGGIMSSLYEVIKAIAVNTATTTLDVSQANIFSLSLANTTKLAFTNFKDVPNGTLSYSMTLMISRTVANSVIDWTGMTITWQDNFVPDQSTVVGKTDIFVLETRDKGATWLGFVSGTNR